MKTYIGLPKVIADRVLVRQRKFLHCLYLPIRMADSFHFKVPTEFLFITNLLRQIPGSELKNKYVYLSYECSWVKEGVTQKRPVVHADGFKTNDVNYIWYDKDPTIFYSNPFYVDDDHSTSMIQFEQQANEANEVTYPCETLLRLDATVVHRAAVPKLEGWRTFVKISISNEKYNLKGNTHNPGFDYSWAMFERSVVRNHPICKESDFYLKDSGNV